MGEKVKDSSRLKLCKLLFIYKALSLMIPPFSKSSSYCTLPVLSLSSSEALSGSSTTFSSSAAALSSGSLSGSSTTFSSSASAALSSCSLSGSSTIFLSSASAALSSGSLSGLSTTFSSSAAFEGGFFSCVLAQLKLLPNYYLLKRNIV